MKILIDENMPYAKDLFSQLGEVVLKSGREINADDLIDVDGLMIRSVTKVNVGLIAKANKLKFVGSATAGMDHVDQDLLAQKGIFFTAAPGCNKVGVAEYVVSALMVLAKEQGFKLQDKSIGIIGAGQVGSYLAKVFSAMGLKVLLNDPPKEDAGDTRQFHCLDEVLNADVITLHTPITKDGDYPTWHLIDETRLQHMRSDQILINAARGPVVDNQALKTRLKQQDGFCAVLDVFEEEPNVDLELLPLLRFATPHVAGYGLEGKARGTTMIFNSFCEFIGRPERAHPSELLPVAPISNVRLTQGIDAKGMNHQVLDSLVSLIYDIRFDDAIFRRNIIIDTGDREKDLQQQARAFDRMRKDYWDRREYSALTIEHDAKLDVSALAEIGFKLEVI